MASCLQRISGDHWMDPWIIGSQYCGSQDEEMRLDIWLKINSKRPSDLHVTKTNTKFIWTETLR